MGWGDILFGVLQSSSNPLISAGASFANTFLTQQQQESQTKKASNEYYKALAQQQQLSQIAAQMAQQRAQYEAMIKSRMMSTSSAMQNQLFAAQNNMGAMPQFDEGRVKQDYQATKSSMMQDFTDLLKLVESQGRASQFERLGGAGSMAADDLRMNALVKQYSPELQKIDDAAMDSALSRANKTMDLYKSSRSNTLDEISGLYGKSLEADRAILQANGNPLDGVGAINSSYDNTLSRLTDTEKSSKEAGVDTSKQLGVLLSRITNRQPAVFDEQTGTWR